MQPYKKIAVPFAILLVGVLVVNAYRSERAASVTQFDDPQVGYSIPTISPLMYFGGSTSSVRLVNPSAKLLVGASATTTNAYIETPSLAITGLTGQDCIGTDGSGNVQAGTCTGGSGSGFSTTSADFWDTTKWRWSTTSSDYWLTVRNFFSTTSADAWKDQRNFFSTTSVDAWKDLRNFFSTTSADWWGGTKGYLTSVDISANTNLAATYPVILTNDTLSFPATSTLYGTGTAGYVLMWSGSGVPTWAATSSAIAWGAITGTLTSQTDLNAKFLTKLGTSSVLTAGQVIYATGFNTVASVATGTLSCTSPVSCTSRTVLNGASAVSIADAAADGSTKGAASFTTADFDASSGNISLDRAITGTFTGAWAFTNAASTTFAKGLYANTIAAAYLMATSTSAWSTLPNIRITNASSTNLTASQSLFAQGNRVSGERYITFVLATSTVWTGTSSVSSAFGDKVAIPVPFTGTFTRLGCLAGAGTLFVDAYDGSSHGMVLASSTLGFQTISLSVTKGDMLYVKAGQPSSSPTSTPCTLIGSGY